MKKIILVSIALLLSSLMYSQTTTTGDTIISKNPSNLKLKVIYFHITNRCNTCYAIEKNVRLTMFTHFTSQLDSGVIDLMIVNCELPQNDQLVRKYEAYGSTLVLTSYNNGSEIKSDDISNWSFQKANIPDVFVSDLKTKIEAYLK